MGFSELYFLACCAVTFQAILGQLNNSPLCKNVVPSLNCSLEQPKQICGTNGVTYPTRCDFAKAHCKDLDIKIDFEGVCDCRPVGPDPICQYLVNSTCPPETFLVCASDGNQYTSLCSYQQAKCMAPKLQLVSLGVCPTLMPPTTTTQSVFELICETLATIACQTNLPEVCGSDGLTYASACELEKANCVSNSSITFIQDGPC